MGFLVREVEEFVMKEATLAEEFVVNEATLAEQSVVKEAALAERWAEKEIEQNPAQTAGACALPVYPP